MSSLFICGNGFDIAHGISSKYSDFRSFVIYHFPEALKLRDDIVYLEDIEHIDMAEFAAEILLNTMDNAAGDDWSNFEEALSLINFDKKLPRPNHQENETPEEDNELMCQYLLYMNSLTGCFIHCSKLWADLFRLWIKNIEQEIDSGKYSPKEHLVNLLTEPDTQFITFNYTKTLQRLYGIKKVIHIHNRVGQKLIWGHEGKNISYGQFDNDLNFFYGSSFLDDMLMSFKKDTATQLKKYNDFFKKLDSRIDKVYSYGFSYGRVDSIYIKKIINQIHPNATWYFTAYETKDKEALRIKKIKLRKYGFKGTFGQYDT